VQTILNLRNVLFHKPLVVQLLCASEFENLPTKETYKMLFVYLYCVCVWVCVCVCVWVCVCVKCNLKNIYVRAK
jgi:hypothetical protein